jgi:hypothetical protein
MIQLSSSIGQTPRSAKGVRCRRGEMRRPIRIEVCRCHVNFGRSGAHVQRPGLWWIFGHLPSQLFLIPSGTGPDRCFFNVVSDFSLANEGVKIVTNKQAEIPIVLNDTIKQGPALSLLPGPPPISKTAAPFTSRELRPVRVNSSTPSSGDHCHCGAAIAFLLAHG